MHAKLCQSAVMWFIFMRKSAFTRLNALMRKNALLLLALFVNASENQIKCHANVLQTVSKRCQVVYLL